MKHPLNWLTGPGRSPAEPRALLGDIAEVYQHEIRPQRTWLYAQAWYLRELTMAFFAAVRDKGRSALGTAGHGTSRSPFWFSPLPDVRYAVRRWRRRPAFAASAILTLALGIAAATATAAWRPHARLDWTLGEGDANLIRLMDVSSQFLPLLGVRTVLGRHFDEADEAQFTRNIILTHETWLSRFGGRPDIIGATVRTRNVSSFDEIPRTVVGVLEPGFRFGNEQPDVLVPVCATAHQGVPRTPCAPSRSDSQTHRPAGARRLDRGCRISHRTSRDCGPQQRTRLRATRVH